MIVGSSWGEIKDVRVDVGVTVGGRIVEESSSLGGGVKHKGRGLVDRDGLGIRSRILVRCSTVNLERGKVQ